MNRRKTIIFDILFTGIVIIVFWVLGVFVSEVFGAGTLIPAISTLAVYLISYVTKGYWYGIIGSLICMLSVNFAFTFPYLKFNFSITENLVSAVIMMIITVMTSALTTKLKRQEKLKAETEKEKMRANLLRAVSHDLRTPLTTIYGSSSVLIENYENLSDEKILQLAAGMKEDSEWLIRMVENLLSVTRVGDSKVKLNKSEVVLEELIDAVLVRFKKRYPKQHVDIQIPDDFISIPMDAVLITQVIVNMLENAVQHAKGMTKLGLVVSVCGKNAVFEIIDDGCGIPKDRMEKIFTGYYETKDAPVDNQKRCMGIGLSVCASVIKAHGGEISVENIPQGGCCFRFVLKMEENENGR